MDELPLVSIIIPVRNEGKYIDQCLQHILAQDYPHDRIEVIVVEGHSDDGTREAVKKYMIDNHNIRILDNDKKIVPVAMNIGIKASKGDFVIRVDARCFIAPDYVSKCVHYLKTTGAWNVGGRQQPVDEDTILSKLITLATTSPFGIGGSKFHYSEKAQYVDTVYLGAYPRWVLDKVGYYNESLIRNQDYELNYRIRAAGGKIFFAPDICSVYIGRQTLRKFIKQYFQYGFWKLRVIKMHPVSIKIRHLVAPAFISGIILCVILGFWYVDFFIFSGIMLSAYIIASIFASFIAMRKSDWWTIFLLPVLFLLLHSSWGTGFLWSLLTIFIPPEKVFCAR